jgi:hypothetical protein
LKIKYLIDGSIFNQKQEEVFLFDLINNITKNSDNTVYFPYGSHFFVNKMERLLARREAKFYTDRSPNGFKVFTFSNYYYEYMLNKDLSFIPFWLFKDRFDSEDRLREEPFFIRSDSGNKSCPGQVVSDNPVDRNNSFNFIQTCEQIYKIPPEERLVMSSKKKIDKEWRVVIVDSNIVTDSSYSFDGSPVEDDLPGEIVNYVEEVLSDVNWRPAETFVMDVCLSKNLPYIVEFNAINTSFLYACNKKKFVDALNHKIKNSF